MASLREIEVGLLVKEINESSEEVRAQTERIESVTKLSADQENKVSELEADVVVLAERSTRLESEAEVLRDAQLKVQGALEAARTTLEVAQSKLEGLSALEQSLFEEGQQAGARLAEIERDLASALEEAAKETANRDQLRQTLGGAGNEAKALGQELNALEKELSAARSLNESRHRATVEIAHRQERLDNIAKELAGIEATLPDLTSGVAEAEGQVAEVDAEISKADTELKLIDEKVASTKQADHEAHQQVNSLLSQLATLEGRRRAIESTIASHEGLAQGAKAVLAAVKEGALENVYIPVSEAIETESDLALVIDTALGGAANDLIVPDDRAAKEAIELLKRNRLGRATFQPVSLMRPQNPSRELENVLREKGVVGLASALVVCHDADRPVIDSLLGRIVIVEDLDVGLKLARTNGWSRMVTLDGEVVFSSGAVTGGTQARQVVGVVQRRAELADLAVEAEDLQVKVAELNKQTETL
ncbi:MAG: hypothetical protein ABUL72_02630, partial [Armatimonadota bacterium]